MTRMATGHVVRLRESATGLREPAIARHKTAVDKSGAWDGPGAVAAAKAEAATLRHMHAIFRGNDPDLKANYSVPHHKAGTDTAAVLAGVNNGLARLPQVQGVDSGTKSGAESHLRGHRKDAGLDESLSGAEIRAEVQRIAEAEKMTEQQRHELLGALVEQEVRFQESSQTTKETFTGDTIALREKAIGKDGTVQVKIIQPGWGSSGYYPREMLERDGPSVFKAGTKMFWNHPTESEENARPEGSLYDLAAEIVSDPHFDDGPEGPGLYATAKVFDAFRPAVEELAPHIGVSIRAAGEVQQGEAEGRKGPIITKLTAGDSVDFVTMPGAGGRILQLFESARNAKALPKEEEDEAMTKELTERAERAEKERDELKERAERAETDARREREARLVFEAGEIVAEVVEAKKTEVPEPTAKRLSETLPRTAKLDKEGKFDREAFKTEVEKAVDGEIAYLAEVTGKGRVKGMGGGAPDPKPTDEELKESNDTLEKNLVRLGSTEKAAKLAINA